MDSFKGSPRDARWSAPAFISLNGLSSGLTLGAQRADLLIGWAAQGEQSSTSPNYSRVDRYSAAERLPRACCAPLGMIFSAQPACP